MRTIETLYYFPVLPGFERVAICAGSPITLLRGNWRFEKIDDFPLILNITELSEYN